MHTTIKTAPLQEELIKASTFMLDLLRQARENGGVELRSVLAGEGRIGIAFSLLILAIPTIVPIPNPLGPIFGCCLAFVAVQMLFGRDRLWMPNFIGNRRLSLKIVEATIETTHPWVVRFEGWLKPGRLSTLTGHKARILLALPILLLAVLISLPIPFGNTLPALAITLVAISLAEQDGLMVVLAMTLLTLACFVSYYLAMAAGTALVSLI